MDPFVKSEYLCYIARRRKFGCLNGLVIYWNVENKTFDVANQAWPLMKYSVMSKVPDWVCKYKHRLR